MDEKVLIRFSKHGALRYTGHLDLLRVFQRTIRRAGFPVAYSQGFNPHMLLSFALPLPLGMESVHDYAELSLETPIPPSELAERLNVCSPLGLHITDARMATGESRLAALTAAADYALYLPGTAIPEDTDAILNGLLAEESLVIPKKTKSGIKDADVRPDIFNLQYIAVPEPQIIMRLAAGSMRFLNPQAAAGLVLERIGLELPEQTFTIKRLELYKNNGVDFRSLFESGDA